MKRFLLPLLTFLLVASASAAPLRVYIRGGKKTHGPNAHEHERFLNEWKVMLGQRGVQVDGGLTWPTAEQFKNTDVIVAYAEVAGDAEPEQQNQIDEFTRRGGGLVVIHSAAVAMKNSPWWKATIGGSWVAGKTKWKEGLMDLYYVENERLGGGHPITKDASNFHMDDEIYYDMDISPDVHVLATSFTPNVPAGKRAAAGGKVNIYDIQPQMWAYERTAEGGTQPYRAFVSIPGHLWSTFEKPHYRAILLRGIAWAGKRPNLDEFCKPEELSSLTYPEGGPQRPEETLKNLEIHPDFNLTLVAAEPLINKPMNFDWDAAGRMWVAETPEYPNGRRGMRPDYRGKEWKDHGGIDPTPGVQQRPAKDRISILTDTNADGKMDKKEVFYEGLDLVTGLVFYKDGVIVTQAPDILWLRDVDRDGKAEKVEKLYTGLGTGDTHAVINNPRWGWDGWIYATHGYSAGRVISADGTKQFGNIGSGVIRFKPDGSAFEQYSSKGGNTWGLQITADNRVMWTQPTSGQLLMHTVLPEYALARGSVGKIPSFSVVEPAGKSFPLMTWEQMAYVQIDWVGSFTAAAGCVVYDGGTWPAEYKGDYFTTEPTINLVHHTRLTPKGSSYVANRLPGREATEFIRSRDMWWRPIEVRVGPDGAVYIADFYNQAVIHNDTRGPDHNRVNAAVRPDRDHYFGRIWRLDHKEAKKIEVSNLSTLGTDELMKQLAHGNRHVRMNASRLLMDAAEKADAQTRRNMHTNALQLLHKEWEKMEPDSKVAAMWTLRNSGYVGNEFGMLLKDADPVVRRNAALLMEEHLQTVASKPAQAAETPVPDSTAIQALLTDTDAQVRLAALRALAAGELSDAAARDLVAAWPKFDDDFQRSAAIGAGSRNPVAVIVAAMTQGGASHTLLVGQLAQGIAEKNDPAVASRLVIALADKPATADALKRTVLDSLAKTLKNVPAVTPELTAALGKLLASGASEAVLPLAAKWDKAGALKDAVTKLTATLTLTLNDEKADPGARLAAAQRLIGLRSAVDGALANVTKQLTREGSVPLKRDIIAALGDTADASVGKALTEAYPKLPPDVQAAAYDALLKRSEWVFAFLDAVKAKQVDVSGLGPANLARLRTHPDAAVSRRATDMLDELNPMAKAKNETIAKLVTLVEQPGNAVKGKELFNTACATCHNFGGVGADVGPGLTGMGSHGPSELLTAIVDPNREVDPTFVQWNIETKDGQSYAGIIARENPAALLLKSLAGQQEIKTADIKSRVNTGRSLMPEGLEGLGGEALRDIIAYMQSVDGGRFRTLDLRTAFTASTAQGLYNSQGIRGESLAFLKTGLVNVGGVPFEIVAPEKAANGRNVIVLKGGPPGSFSQSLPQRVDIRAGGFKANRLNILGGVTGWGFKPGGDTNETLSITIHTTQGQRETIVCRNGVEFADYIGRIDVPGSKFAEGLVREHQVRWFTKQLAQTVEIDRITLESLDRNAAPTIVAITAELADPNAAPAAGATAAAAPAPAKAAAAPASTDAPFVPQFSDPVPQPPAKANGPRVLLVGGGSSHDFVKLFGATDKAILAPHVGWVEFTQNANGVPAIMKDLDVLVWSANQPIASETAKALTAWADSGKPLVLLHPGTWYLWKNFPEWNSKIVGGGTRSHDNFGEFEVVIENRAHPVTAGVSERFKITDELYNFIPDPAGSPIDVLATATSPKTNKTFPQVFLVKHPKARIVGITLGHDAKAHDLPDFQKLLKQAVLWAAGKTAVATR